MREFDNSVIVAIQNHFPPLIANSFRKGCLARNPLHAGSFFLNSFHATIRFLAAVTDSCCSNFFEKEWTGLRRIDQYIEMIRRQDRALCTCPLFERILNLFNESGDFAKFVETLSTFYTLWTDEEVLSGEDFHSLDETTREIARALNTFFSRLLFLQEYLLVSRAGENLYAFSGSERVATLLNPDEKIFDPIMMTVLFNPQSKSCLSLNRWFDQGDGSPLLFAGGFGEAKLFERDDFTLILRRLSDKLFAPEAAQIPTAPFKTAEQLLGRNYFLEKGDIEFMKLERLFHKEREDVTAGVCTVHFLVNQNDPGGEYSLKKLLHLKPGHPCAEIREWAERVYLARTAEREAELERGGLYEDLASLLIEKGRLIADHAARLDEYLKLSRIYTENLGQKNEGFLCLYKAIEISQFDADRNRKAEELASETGRLEELANLFYEKAIASAHPDNLEFALHSARIFSRELGKYEEATVILKWILSGVEFREDLLSDLLRLLFRLDKAYEYCETAEKYLDRIKDHALLRDVLMKLVHFYEEKLAQPSKALFYMGRLLNIEPDNILHYRRYFDIAFRSGEQSRLYDEFLFLTETPLPVEVKRECLLAIAKADAKDPSKRERLLSVYEKLLLIEPENREALEYSVSFLAGAGRSAEAIPLLLKLAEISAEDEKMKQLFKIADIYEENLGNLEGALTIYRKIHELQPANETAAVKIEQLLEKRGLYSELLRFLDSLPGEPETALLLKKASILKDRIGLLDRACSIYWRVIFSDPLNREAYDALKEIYTRHGDYENLAALYKHVEKFIDDFTERSRVLFELGKLYLERFGEREQAIYFFEEALSLFPEFMECADMLANLYFGMRNFAKIPPVVEPFIKKLIPEKESEQLRSYRNMLASVAFETGDNEKAVEEFRELVKLAPDRYDYSLMLAKSLMKIGRNEEAYSILEGILNKQKTALDPDNLYYILSTLGTTNLESGNYEQALQLLEEAYNLKGTLQKELLLKLAHASEKSGDFEKEEKYYSMLIDAASDQTERYNYLMKSAEINLEKRKDSAKAVKLLKEAAEIKPDSRATLHLLLSAAVDLGEFPLAFDTLVRIVSLEENGAKKAHYHYTSAMLAKDNLNDEALAVMHLEKTLLYNPDHEEAIAELEGIYQKKNDYSKLVQLYRRCYRNAQMKGETKKVKECLEKLADLYYYKLANIPQAVAYYEEIFALSPDDMGLMKTLCALYERDPAYAEKALALNMRMMRLDRNLSGHIRAIKQIFTDRGDTDAVWCASGALVVLNEANEQEREFFEKFRIPALKLKRTSIDGETFNELIRSPEDDLLVGEVFSLIYPHLGGIIPWKVPSDFGLTEADLLDLSKRTHFNDIILAACRIFSLPAPRVYCSKNRIGFIKMPVYPAAIAVGDDIVNYRRGKELRFIVGRMLTSLFPFRILAWIVDVRTLRAIFVASLKLVFPEFSIDPADAEVKYFASVFRERLPEDTKKRLLDILTKYRKERKEINLLSWENGVELTSDRVGFILANDIEAAVKMIREEKVQLGALDAEQRFEELVQYSVSEQYLKLRKIIF